MPTTLDPLIEEEAESMVFTFNGHSHSHNSHNDIVTELQMDDNVNVTISNPINNSPNTCSWKDISFLIKSNNSSLRRDWNDFQILRDLLLSHKDISSFPPLYLLKNNPINDIVIKRQIICLERYINLLLRHPLYLKNSGSFYLLLKGFITKEFGWKAFNDDDDVVVGGGDGDIGGGDAVIGGDAECKGSIIKFIKLLKGINNGYEKILLLNTKSLDDLKEILRYGKFDLRLRIKDLTGNDHSMSSSSPKSDVINNNFNNDVDIILDYIKMLLEWSIGVMDDISAFNIHYNIVILYLEDAFVGELGQRLKSLNRTI